MSEFEQWFLDVIGIVDQKMGITIDLFSMDEWLPSYQLGQSPIDAVKDRYGLK